MGFIEERTGELPQILRQINCHNSQIFVIVEYLNILSHGLLYIIMKKIYAISAYILTQAISIFAVLYHLDKEYQTQSLGLLISTGLLSTLLYILTLLKNVCILLEFSQDMWKLGKKIHIYSYHR